MLTLTIYILCVQIIFFLNTPDLDVSRYIVFDDVIRFLQHVFFAEKIFFHQHLKMFLFGDLFYMMFSNYDVFFAIFGAFSFSNPASAMPLVAINESANWGEAKLVTDERLRFGGLRLASST